MCFSVWWSSWPPFGWHAALSLRGKKYVATYCTFANPVAGCGAEKGFVVFKGMYRFFYLFILYQSVIIAILCNCLLQLLVINQIKLYFGSWFSTFFILLLRFAKDVKGENKQMSLSLIKAQPLKRLSLTVTNAAFMQKNLIVGQFLKWIDYHQTFRDIFENLSVCN